MRPLRCAAGAIVTTLLLAALDPACGSKRSTRMRARRASGVSIYLPEHPRRGSLPAVVGAHGTTGLADECAPSHAVDHPYLDALNVSWAASGLPVIAPDYAGLGAVGVQGYNNFADTGRSVLDSARALRRLVGPDRLDETAVFSGHSQGGGAALAAAAYAGETPDVNIAGVVAFAPAWTYLSLVEGIHLASA